MLISTRDGDGNGVIALAGFVSNDPHDSVYAGQYFVGIVDRGFMQARPKDPIGPLFNYNPISGRLCRAQAGELTFHLPVSDAATGMQTREVVLELNYQTHIVDGLDFQPGFQCAFRPNSQHDIRNAVVFPFKVHPM